MEKFVVIYFLFPKTKEIFYLIKDRPKIPHLHMKHLGFGGKVEKDESEEDAIIREVKEELDFEIDKSKLIHQGILVDYVRNREIHIFKMYFDEKIFKEGIIEGEGVGVYKNYTFHKENPETQVDSNYLVIDRLIESDKAFKVEFRGK